MTENQKIRIERRRYPRKAIQLWIHCAELENGKVLRSFTNLTEDMSAGGLAIHSTRIYKIDQPLLTTVLLPPAEAQGDITRVLHFSMDEYQPVGILSRVVWFSLTEKQSARIGIEFIELSSAGMELFKNFFVTFGLEYANGPLFQE